MNIAHLWAAHNLDGQEVKPLKKNTGQGSNFWWEGDTIYSYGRHFPIACVIEHKKKKAVLFTTRRYSVTTSNHISMVRSALYSRSTPVFDVKSPGNSPRDSSNKEYYESGARAAYKAATTARSRKEALLKEAQGYITDGNKFAQFFGLKWRLKPLEAKALAKLQAEAKAENTKALAARKEKEAAQKALREAAEAWEVRSLEAWVSHAPFEEERPRGYFRGHWAGFAPKLRIKDHETVETSLGAEVPVSHAKRLMALIQKIKATGKEYVRNGHTEHVGAFAVDWIKADGSMKAGCHTFEAAEIERFRPILEAVK